MVFNNTKPSNTFVRLARRLYNPLGFSKGYNAILWFFFDGAFLGFTLARLQYFNVWGVFCNPTTGTTVGECYWYENFDRNRAGIILHLAAILPAAFLAAFQFVPIIRHKFILYHRIAGYVIFLLVVLSDIGSLMIANHAFGGDYATQTAIGLLVIITTVSLVLAYINIKRLQIDRHRAWMLRAWVYFGCIITVRAILGVASSIQATSVNYENYVAMDCNAVLFIYQGNQTQLYTTYPACDPNNSKYANEGHVVVKTNVLSNDLAEYAAAIGSNFGMALFLAMFLHAVGIEIYLRQTPREGARLRQLSYERQLEAGYKNPGSAGIVFEKFADADPWTPMAGRGRPQFRESDSSTSVHLESSK